MQHLTKFVLCGWVLIAALLPTALCAQTRDNPRTVQLEALTDDTLLLVVDEGFVIHHGQGERGRDDALFIEVLDGEAAQASRAYRISSSDDRNYNRAKKPTKVNRKTKPTDFADYCDQYLPDATGEFDFTCINDRPDRANEHYLYLQLPTPLINGASYTLTSTIAGIPDQTITYNDRESRSEALHVNQLGYVRAAGEKFGYVYHWLGDGGGLDLGTEARSFVLINTRSGRPSFTGLVSARKPVETQELARADQAPPFGNLLGVASWELNFSSFTRPGNYRLCVDGVGCSFEFTVGDDIYRAPMELTVEGVYQQRSGIATEAPYTSQPRPAPHRVGVTPGFAGRLKYSTVRAIDYANFNRPSGQQDDIDAAILGDLEAWGWYQDAGDWDSYFSHTGVSAHLLWLYEMTADSWADDQLNLPEAGNGLPDLLDEALWNMRFHHRLRMELLEKAWGTGGVGGGRVFGDLWGGDKGPNGELRGSWEDVDRNWIVSGEDPMITYMYAGLAAHAAKLISDGGFTDPEGVDWASEAVAAYAWARDNTQSGDEDLSAPANFRHVRFFAAANLYRLTGDASYETQVANDYASVVMDNVSVERSFGQAAFRAASNERPRSNPDLVNDISNAITKEGRNVLRRFRDDRAARWGGNYFLPIVNGQATTPIVLDGVFAHYFSPQLEPIFVDEYRDALYSTADYFLGNNPLNMAWLSGLADNNGPAERTPADILALDAWVLGGDTPRAGMIPYGPTSTVYNFRTANGAFNIAWPFKTIYPVDEDDWPAHELWFEQRQSPTTVEYTVHQNTAPGLFLYGYLHAISTGAITLPASLATVRTGHGIACAAVPCAP